MSLYTLNSIVSFIITLLAVLCSCVNIVFKIISSVLGLMQSSFPFPCNLVTVNQFYSYACGSMLLMDINEVLFAFMG